ncbi:hypothetical protein Ahy_B06g085062 [Arachis hypogaea]|uniref:Aspartic peptidase DDI1-type domain-containing protein n=1 Tax=Arachis hypogaea TaxID=3818 RepID=A0A444YTF3_ARAHY|nr:hypothetical protein Ahy_B06g085062 [Arachis hypogaea]
MSKNSQDDKTKGATPSVHSRVVFPIDGETCPKGIPSPVKLDNGKAVFVASRDDKDKVADPDEEYFEKGNPVEDYDIDDEEAFSFIRYEDEHGYFQRPSEKQKSHLHSLHITAVMSGIKINKVLIDGGVAISLLPERILMKVDRVLNSFNCKSFYLTSEGLNVKLRHSQP